jgi:predicted RNA-binding Zn ribbon-like protein
MAGMDWSASVTGKRSLDGNIHPMQSDAPHRSPSRAGSLPLIGGRLCIDFANTASGREGPRRQEHLRRYPDLIAWTLHAGMLDRSDASILERAAAADPEGARRALEAALQLRESIHDLLLSLVREKAPRAGDLDRLNLALADAMSRARIGTAPDGFAWDWPRPAADPLSSQLTYPIWPIARSAAELLLSPLRDRLRECPGEHCGQERQPPLVRNEGLRQPGEDAAPPPSSAPRKRGPAPRLGLPFVRADPIICLNSKGETPCPQR